ncbi:leucine-rich repeat protein, partial [Candidatus Poribacteria bacterium]|nr:leucine-rich repeat protein [Candidatus Poribacteria bacterium]
MKPLIEKRKWTLAIFFILLMFFGTYLQGDAAVTPVSGRTPQVRDAIVATVPGIDAPADVTEAHLAAITTLNMKGQNIATLKADDFDGLTALSDLNLYGNQLRRLPDGIFEGLTALTTLRLGGNAIDPLPMPVTLEKVAEGQFKAVAPTGATFDYVLSITATNGSIVAGATTVSIPHGRVESETLTVTRTPGTTGEVTVAIETLPRLPNEHYGYAFVRSDTLPLSVITKINTAPVFIDGTSTTRSVAEDTVAATNIGAAIAARDAENDTLTYTLSGADASAFAMDSATGQLKTKAPLNYETQNAYRVTITVSDGSLTDTITVIINVTDIVENTAPSFYEGNSTTRFVFENTAVGLNIGTPVLATDSTDDFLRYTLGGVHADAFAIDTATGQLKTKAPLDYEAQRLYTVTITVDDAEFSDTITVIISLIDVNDPVMSVGFVPVIERTPEVRDAIVAVVPNATDAATVTEAEVAAITILNLRNSGISFLKAGDFSGMTALRNLNLYNNHLSSLPTGVFTGLPALTTLRLGGNVLDPLPLIVSLQSVGPGAFKAVMPTGAPFNIVLPIGVTTDGIPGGTTRVMIPQGSMESETFTVVGTGTGTPKVAFLRFPGLPTGHYGYTIAQSTVCNRTEQVAAAIAAAVGVEDCSTVTELDLAAITSLDLSNAAITTLQAGDFDGMLSLTTLSLDGNTLTHLPSGIFDDLVSLTELYLNANELATLPSGIFRNLTALTQLYLQRNDLRSLSAGVFDGLSALYAINLQENALTDLPSGLFDGTPYLRSLLLSHNNLTSLPAGIFQGVTALEQLHLRWNPDAASQLPLVVALEKVGTHRFKAVVPSGAPFEIMLPIKVANGSLVDGATAIIIPKGGVESRPMTLTRTPNTIDAVTVDIETPLPMPPTMHNGYVLVKSALGPLEVIQQINVPPVFTEGADTRRTIAENVATGTDVGTPVIATDANTDTTLTYTLNGNPDAAAFDLDSQTGQLKTKAPLDFETQKMSTVTLTVSDGTLTDTIVVTIKVSDVNEAPVFATESLTTHTVTENTPAGENIGTPY